MNKIDHPSLEAQVPEFYRFGLDPLYPVSATHGQGLGALLEALGQVLPSPRELPRAGPGYPGGHRGPPQRGEILPDQPFSG